MKQQSDLRSAPTVSNGADSSDRGPAAISVEHHKSGVNRAARRDRTVGLRHRRARSPLSIRYRSWTTPANGTIAAVGRMLHFWCARYSKQLPS
ncbi:hypothetical protein I546_4261 [Mycobacterium kansasii 732]|nr:hypothetical protein I546_4261 [Mycobacterium kansasii 732]